MCRIAAIVSKELNSLYRISEMTDVMHRGGPDGSGHVVNESLGYALGHRRLSIIDLSENAKQPMSYQKGRYAITFNGEIYNFRELRDELTELGHTFISQSDTEVLLAGYYQWGSALLPRLKGMFAFIIADNLKEELFLARDHMGIKPLYMGKRGGDFFFSSEVRAIRAIDQFWTTNLEWSIWFLTFGFLPEPITTLEKVWSLKPGYFTVFDLNKHTYLQQRWFKNTTEIEWTENTAVEATRALFRQSIERHLLADVKVGVFLSGGIDSSIIAVLASEFSKEPIDTISIDFEDDIYSERRYQEIIVNQIGSRHHRFVVTKDEFMDAWDDICQSLDQPTSDAINSYFICKYAKKIGLKVVLSGIGADEFFGGYPSFHRTDRVKQLHLLRPFLKWVPTSSLGYPMRKIGFLKRKIEIGEYLLYRGLFTPGDVAKILHLPEKKVWDVIGKYKMPGEQNTGNGDKTKVSLFESDIYMMNQLLKDSDVQSMWHGIELRVPFLDIDLVNFIRLVPEEIKYPDNKHKHLLLAAFKDCIPAAIYQRKKQGFTFPFDKWLGDIPAIKNPLFVPGVYFQRFLKGSINYSRLWSIFLSTTYSKINNLREDAKGSNPNTLFLYLSSFGKAGGIEKVNKIVMASLDPQEGFHAEAYGLHDDLMDSRYFQRGYFKGFSGARFAFLKTLFIESRKYDRIIIGHLNLAPAAWLMCLRNRSLKIVVIVHGIEAWGVQKRFSKWLLNKAGTIVSVSDFTRQQLIKKSGINGDKIKVLHNCLDPFFLAPSIRIRKSYLKERYKINDGDKVLMTITRMNKYEKYKGYDQVLQAIAGFPEAERKSIKYILAGKADKPEADRIRTLIDKYHIKEQVIIPGFIEDDELMDHYLLGDVFILPSKKEGFGIVLIEAVASGIPVIAGNCDGSVEALQHGVLGQLIDPDDIDVIQKALRKVFFTINDEKHKIVSDTVNQTLALKTYDFKKYKKQFQQIISES